MAFDDGFNQPYGTAQPPAAAGGPGLMGRQSQIQQWYQQYLGRQASQDEINAQMQNPGGDSAVETLLKNSPEAAAWTASHPATAPTASTPTAPTGSTRPVPPAPAAGSYDYSQALAKVQQAAGRQLSPAEIQGLFAKFGGDQNSTFTDASLAPVIASLQGTPKPATTGIAQSDDPNAKLYQGTNNPPGYTGYGAPPPQPGAPPPPPTTGGTGTGGTGTGQSPAPTTPGYTPPAAYAPPPAFAYQGFQAPTGNDVLNDPGYQFEFNQGIQAIGAKNAALGTLNTGGAMKDFIGYGQNLASTKYNDIFNRQFSTYNANRGNAVENYNTNYGTQYKDPYTLNYASQYADPFQFGLAQRGQDIGQQQFKASLGQNAYQFGASLGQNQQQFTANLGQNAYQFGANLNQNSDQFGRTLNQNSDQFGRTLGQNNDQFGRSLNQNNTQFTSSLDWQKFLQNYKATTTDPFDQKYKLLGLL